MRDEIEEIIKTENIDRTRFHEFDKHRYNEIINKFYYTFFDYEKYKSISLNYLWLKIRSDVENEIVQRLNQCENWEEYIRSVVKYIPDINKMYYLILDYGWVYEGYLSEIQNVLFETTGLLGDFYIVSKKFDKVICHCDDGDNMSVFEKLPSIESNRFKIVKAQRDNLNDILKIYKNVTADMESKEIFQWDNLYPDKNIIKEDIVHNEMFIAKKHNNIIGAFTINHFCDDEYKNGNWKYPNASYNVIHRLCVNPEYQNQGYAAEIMQWIEKYLKNKNIKTIRLDAFTKNKSALRLYEKLGYTIVGHTDWRKGRFFLMEKKL